MTATQIVALVSAVAVVAWTFRDQIERLVALGRGREQAARRGPSYQQSMLYLASVRLRLIETSTLSKDAASAVETLTLALMSGSDK